MESAIDWISAGETQLAGVVDLRREIHADPELGLQCPRTTQKIKRALAGLPLEIKDSISTTGFIAILRGGRGSGRTVLLRGDMDALPMREKTGLSFASTTSAMHACGHDAHTAMLVGAAKALCERRELFAGTIVFMFQPGEEGWHGARYMIEDGLLNDPRPEAAFALHVYPNLTAGVIWSRPGPVMASSDTLKVLVEGRGGHAALPHECLDPIPVACEIVTSLQSFVARQISVSDPAVLTITKIRAGTASNVIPTTAEMLGTLRTLSEKTRSFAKTGFQRIVEHIAAAHGMTGTALIEEGFPVTVNDPRAVELVRQVAISFGGESGWLPMQAPMMGAEDFAYVLAQIPGAISFIGVAPIGCDPLMASSVHNTRMMIEESTMAKGVAIHCATAQSFLVGGFNE